MVKNIRPISNNYIYLSLHVGVVILSSLSFLEVMHDIKFGSMEVGGRTTEGGRVVERWSDGCLGEPKENPKTERKQMR